MTTIAYADCPSGLSGDMFLAACLDLGVPLETIESGLDALDLRGYSLKTWTEPKQGLMARRLEVLVEEKQHPHRAYRDIKALILAAALPAGVGAKAMSVFERLAEAEGRIHGLAMDEVHFHEVGAVDSIVDVVGVCLALNHLGVTRLVASPLPLGSGFVETAHGRLPLPAPATLALLTGTPTYGTGLPFELVTPTGAALIKTLADGFGPQPAITLTGVGYGAGSRNLPDRPNLMRLVLGQAEEAAGLEKLTVGEANLDDMNPEFLPHLLERLLSAGALDAWLTPIQMKKGRPAFTCSFLARPGRVAELASVLFSESSTLGLRTYPVDRLALRREEQVVSTEWGEVKVKAVHRQGRVELVPEFEACRRIAEESRLPLREVYARLQALAASRDQG
jgi:hypothetical protein